MECPRNDLGEGVGWNHPKGGLGQSKTPGRAKRKFSRHPEAKDGPEHIYVPLLNCQSRPWQPAENLSLRGQYDYASLSSPVSPLTVHGDAANLGV